MFTLPVVLLLMIWFWPTLWFKLVKNRIEVNVEFEKRQATPGEAIPIRVRIQNRGWVPCPFVRLSIDLPPGLSASEKHVEHTLYASTYLLMRQEAELKLLIFGVERGVQSIRTVTVHLNDGLGIKDVFLHFDQYMIDVAILPEFATASQMKLPIQDFLGRFEVVRWLHPDEAMLRGIRDYQRGDSFKHIAWHASAKSGKWMTKQFSSTSETTVKLVLNAQLFEPYWNGTTIHEFNALCSLAATWSAWLQGKGAELEFVSNCTISRDPRRQDHGRQRAEGIRSLLGRAHPYANSAFEQVLQTLIRQAGNQSPIIIFSSFFTPTQVRQLMTLAYTGRDITIVGGPGAQRMSQLQGLVNVITFPVISKERAVGE